VRAEVDCVYKKDPTSPDLGALVEIKSKKYNAKKSALYNTDYLKTVWAQMLFGYTELLNIGEYDLNSRGEAVFREIFQTNFKRVSEWAGMNQPDKPYLSPLTKLVGLLKWIKDNMRDGDNKMFSYSVSGQLFTLA